MKEGMRAYSIIFTIMVLIAVLVLPVVFVLIFGWYSLIPYFAGMAWLRAFRIMLNKSTEIIIHYSKD